MTDPWGIIVRPTDRGHALLHPTPGFSGASVPSVRLHRRFTSVDGLGADAFGILLEWVPGRTGNDDALPLWWAGTFVPEAYDRARRVAVMHLLRGGWADTFVPDVHLVAGLAEALAAAGLCRTIHLDLTDNIVRERTP